MDIASQPFKFTVYLRSDEGYPLDTNPVDINIGNNTGSEFLLDVSVPLVLNSPSLIIGQSNVSFYDYTVSSYNSEYEVTIQSISLTWNPVENASGYKVFFIENLEDVMAYSTLQDGIYLSPKGEPLFTNQTELLTTNSYTYSYKYPSSVSTIYAFVFAYSIGLQSLLPTTIFRSIISDYTLNTASSRYMYKDLLIRTIDNQDSDGNGDIIETKSALRYPYTIVVVPNKGVFTDIIYRYKDFLFKLDKVVQLSIVGEADTLNDVERIEFTLDRGITLVSINDGGINIIVSPSGVYTIYLIDLQPYENKIAKLKFSDETNIFPSLDIILVS